MTVSIQVVEHLASDVCAVECRIRHHANSRGCHTGHRVAAQTIDALSAIHELAFADSSSYGEQQHDRALSSVAYCEIAPDELAAYHRGFCRHTVEARRSFHVAEARREAVYHAYILQRQSNHVAYRDGVWHELTARDIEQRRRLGDGK